MAEFALRSASQMRCPPMTMKRNAKQIKLSTKVSCTSAWKSASKNDFLSVASFSHQRDSPREIILGNSKGRGLPVRLPLEYPSPEVDKCVSHTQQDAVPWAACSACSACSAFFKVRDEGARWRVRGDGFRSLAPPTIQENYGRGTPAV